MGIPLCDSCCFSLAAFNICSLCLIFGNLINMCLGVFSVFWRFVEFSLLWSFLAVCGFVQVPCQGFLVREACIGVLVGGAGFLLSGVQ